MTDFLVYRTGSNASNQSCTFEPVPIAIVQAKSRDHACETTWGGLEPSVHGCPHLLAFDEDRIVAAVMDTNVWSNQRLHAVPRSRAKKQDWSHVLEWDADRIAWQENWGAEIAYYEAREEAGELE